MSNFPYDVALFDLDGTLFDAADGIINSALYTMEVMQLPVPENANLFAMIGPPIRFSMAHIFNVPTEKVEEAVRIYRKRFAEVGMYEYKVFPHVRAMLYALKKAGIFVALATAKPTASAKEILAYYHLSSFFDCIQGVAESKATLDKAEIIRHALPTTYRKACMVGDRLYDMQGAKGAHVDAIGVDYEKNNAEELWSSGADYVFNSVTELLHFLCPQPTTPKGCFISVEGPDGSGKTTQVAALMKRLIQYGYDVYQTREPGGCKVSEEIRSILLNTNNAEMCDECEALLYAAARAQHTQQVIKPALTAGKLVLCDRYVDSSIAYQGGARSLGLDEVASINHFGIGDCMPKHTVYLDIHHKTALQRRLNTSAPDRLEQQDISFHAKVEEAYKQLIEKNHSRFLIVNASLPAEEVADEVWTKVLSVLEE